MPYIITQIPDVAGGDSASILDAMRRAMDVSTHLEIQREEHRAINWKEALYLATLGGAKGRGHKKQDNAFFTWIEILIY